MKKHYWKVESKHTAYAHGAENLFSKSKRATHSQYKRCVLWKTHKKLYCRATLMERAWIHKQRTIVKCLCSPRKPADMVRTPCYPSRLSVQMSKSILKVQGTPNSQDNVEKDENRTNPGMMTHTCNFSFQDRRLTSWLQSESYTLSQTKQKKMLKLQTSYNPAILLSWVCLNKIK